MRAGRAGVLGRGMVGWGRGWRPESLDSPGEMGMKAGKARSSDTWVLSQKDEG